MRVKWQSSYNKLAQPDADRRDEVWQINRYVTFSLIVEIFSSCMSHEINNSACFCQGLLAILLIMTFT